MLVPLVLATVFGGLRVQDAMASAGSLRLAAARADVIPAITKYMSALDVALLASSTGRDVEGAKKNYEARKYELQTRLADTDVIPDVRSGVSTLLNGGQGLLDKVLANSISLRDRVTTYAPILLTAEDVINASVRVDNEQIRAQAQGLSRAVGARGQMTMQEILVTRGADLPEPELRTSMMTLAGTEPSTLFGMSEVLGVGSPEAKTLQQQMVTRMAIMSDPASALVDNSELLHSIQTTDGIAEQVINDATASVTNSVQAQATARRDCRDARRRAGAGGHRDRAGHRVAGGACAGPAAARAARRRAQGRPHRPRGRDRPNPRRRRADPARRWRCTPPRKSARSPTPSTNCTPRRCCWPATRRGCDCWSTTCSRPCRGAAGHWSTSSCRSSTGWSATRRIPTGSTACSGWITWRPGCAATAPTCWCWPARSFRVTSVSRLTLSTVINAAVSEVEDYRRVQIAGMPDSTLIGAAVGGIIHLLAELIDNALRYSPPTTPVRVSAARGGDGGVLLWVSDSGLGMNDGDRRIANMRLQSGGEVTPENARHMGLFVVGRLAARHGLRVGLRGPTPGWRGRRHHRGGLPPAVRPRRGLDDQPCRAPRPRQGEWRAGAEPRARARRVAPPPHRARARVVPQWLRTAGDVVAAPHSRFQRHHRRPCRARRAAAEAARAGHPVVGEERGPGAAPSSPEPAEPQPVAATTDRAATSSRRKPRRTRRRSLLPPALVAGPGRRRRDLPGGCSRRWLGDPHDLVQSPDLDWQSVWDRGWSLAAEAEDKPVESRTDHGLPVRTPGARLVPGRGGRSGAPGARPGRTDPDGASAGEPQHAAAVRDPEAVRASIGSHFGGVHSGRSHARETDRSDEE